MLVVFRFPEICRSFAKPSIDTTFPSFSLYVFWFTLVCPVTHHLQQYDAQPWPLIVFNKCPQEEAIHIGWTLVQVKGQPWKRDLPRLHQTGQIMPLLWEWTWKDAPKYILLLRPPVEPRLLSSRLLQSWWEGMETGQVKMPQSSLFLLRPSQYS